MMSCMKDAIILLEDLGINIYDLSKKEQDQYLQAIGNGAETELQILSQISNKQPKGKINNEDT